MTTETFHEFLFNSTKRGPMTVLEIMDDLRVMTLNKCDMSGLPTNGIQCQEMLERLLIAGKATRNGSQWKWAEPVAKREPQRELFS